MQSLKQEIYSEHFPIENFDFNFGMIRGFKDRDFKADSQVQKDATVSRNQHNLKTVRYLMKVSYH